MTAAGGEQEAGSVSLSVAKAVRWSAAGRTLAQLFRWAMTLVVIRILAPEDYGLVALAIALLDTVGTFYEMGLAPALIQAKTLEKDDARKISGIILMLNIVLCLGFLALAPWIASFFDEPKLATVLCLLAFMFPIAGLASAPNAILKRSLDFKKVTILNVIAEMSGAIMSLVLALSGFGVWSLVLGHLTYTTISATLVILACPVSCMPKFSLGGTRHFFNFGGRIVLQRLVGTVYARADVFILGRVFDAATVGVYSVALEFGSMPLRKIAPIINEIAFAGFSKIQDDKARIADYLEKAFRFLSLFGLPVFAGLSSVAPELTAIVLGPKWSEAALPLQLLSLIIPLRLFADPLQEVLNGIGQAKLALQNTSIMACIVISGFLIGVQWGILGMCLAWLICLPIAFTIVLIRAAPFSGLGVSRFLGVIMPPLLTCLAMYLVVIGFGQLLPLPVESILRLVLLVGAGALTYGTIIMLLRPRDIADLWHFLRS